MITGRDILYISSIEWDFLWQAHQEIARRFAAAGNRVLYIENTGVRAPVLKDTKRVASRLGRWVRSLRSGGARQVADNIFVYSPLVLPPFGARWQRVLNRRVFLGQLRGITRSLGIKNPLIWTYLPTDTAVDIVRMYRTESSVVVYYNMADFSFLTGDAQRLEKSERELATISDEVFATCSDLANKLAKYGRTAHIFPPGVNLSAFPEPQSSANSLDSLKLGELPRPMIGYVGGLHRLVDYDLLAAMARARPSWSWVFLGAQQAPLEKLRELPNIFLLGQQPHDELAGHLAFFDVCIVPYLNTREMASVVPTKINEYLAAGKAVVSTDLPTVLEFNAQHHILQTSPPTPHDFLLAIEAQLPAAHDPDLQQKRRAVAAQAAWATRIEQMSALVAAKFST